MIDEQLHEQSKKLFEETRIVYNSVGKIYCPCLNQHVVFNAKGFHHFKYHGGGEARTRKDIMYKLILFPLVIPVLKLATTLNDYQKVLDPKVRSRNHQQKEVEYWSIVSSVGKNKDVRVKVVLKRVGKGNIIFWSVMKLK